MKSPLSEGIRVIEEYLLHLPETPGVYRMLNAKGDALYVGKAKNLKKRVASYIEMARLSDRLKRMVAQTTQMEFTHTRTEVEALLLEANLIKSLSPRYNILLKDGKTYPMILITQNHPFPRVQKHRGERKIKGKYFGPYPSALSVNKAIIDIQRAFKIRPCADNIFANRTRPCMEYQIKRCSAPCVGHIDEAAYKERVQQALDFLSGKQSDLQKNLAQKMEEASSAMEFEKAADYRDRIRALSTIQAEQHIHIATMEDADIVALHREEDTSCIQLIIMRGGKQLGHQNYFLNPLPEESQSDILRSFLLQLYQETPPPAEVIISHELAEKEPVEQALSELAQHNVSLHTPKRSDKKQLIEHALKNAREALMQKRLKVMSERERLSALAKLLSLPQIKRIDVFDNSHLMGTHEIGAMIVAKEEGFSKRDYRRFTIKHEARDKGDDYGMLREVLTRRLTRLLTETPDYEENIWPDVMLIDGGKGQLGVAIEVKASLNISRIVLLAIAKGPDRNAGREEFFTADGKSFTLPPNDPVLFYLQRLRDEAHRFAIEGHRARREKHLVHSSLEEISGIGAKRKRALLNHFGSLTGIKNATISDLTAVNGIDQSLAEEIYAHFH